MSLVTAAIRPPRTLILDVYGAYARSLGGWLAVADLVRLMGTLSVDQAAVRSAVVRMTRRSLLEAEVRGAARGYRLTAAARSLLEEGDRRIFTARKPADLADGWVLVSFSVPERERHQRHALRTRLTWLGLGKLSNGLWIGPQRVRADLTEALAGSGLQHYADIFDADYMGFDDPADMVRRSWDLDALRARYRAFLEVTGPMLRRWRGRRNGDGRQAFVDYTLTLHRWRMFPYLDPGLPRQVLPAGWEGEAAAVEFFEARRRLARPAARYVQSVVRGRVR